jgi:peptidoglycan/LPS O-acetylase OafA/YrhL
LAQGRSIAVLGTYRLCLALAVALSHIGIRIGDLNPGVIAVVGFYLLSGYVMTGLLRTHYPRLSEVPRFYADRALRLFPHYLFVAGITLAWFLATGTETAYLKTPPTASALLENLLIVPLNYFMLHGSNRFTLIPPAWSLGVELQFYALLPFVLLLGSRIWVMLASLTVYLLAAFGVLPTGWFGYFLPPGVLFMFLLASLLRDLHGTAHRSYAGGLAAGVMAGAILLAAMLLPGDRLFVPCNRETLLGLGLGLPILHGLARRNRRAWDERLGHLSYGIFLNHFLVKWCFFEGPVKGGAAIGAYLALCLALAAVTYGLVERPALRLRHGLRAKRRAGSAAPAGEGLAVATMDERG